MRRLALLVAVGATWLFLAALPVLADGGPHVASVNNGVSSLTADSCAGCHRVHTANGPLLLQATDEEALCLSCHGAASTGATTDVATGVQYVPAANGTRTGTQLGALRGGGFEEARIGDPFRYTVDADGAGPGTAVSRLGKVQVAAAPEVVTSAHMPALGGLTQPGVAWGNGANGSGAGPAATVSCGSCHNPHGNGQYRILNPIPATTGVNAAWVASVVDYGVAAANTYRTAASHSFLVGDSITVAGNGLAGANVTATVATVPANNTFTLTGITAAGTGTGGTATRVGGVKVIDAALAPAGDARNYTVIQTPTTAGYTLLASQAGAFSPTSGDYFHYRVPWNGLTGTTNIDAPNGIPGPTLGDTGFSQQITAWCSSCHTRYMAYQQPLTNPADGTVGAAYNTARPGDSIFEYQHRTRGASGRGCLTCHVSHGSNALMTGANSSTFTYPNGTASDNSRLLKVDNRGTCQQCHDPTGTAINVGEQFPPAPYPVPGAP